MKHCCTKNVFTFNNVIYEQIDVLSMWSCLGPMIANFIMTELEIKVVDSLFKDGLLKFYICYVDNFVTFIKKTDIVNVLSKLKACFCYFYQIFVFHQMITLQKLWKMFFSSWALFLLEIFNFLYFSLLLLFSQQVIALEVDPRKS